MSLREQVAKIVAAMRNYADKAGGYRELEVFADELEEACQGDPDTEFLQQYQEKLEAAARADLKWLVEQSPLGQYTPVTLMNGSLAGLMVPLRTGSLQTNDTFSLGGIKYRYGTDGKGYLVEEQT